MRINSWTYTLLVSVFWTLAHNAGLWQFLSGLPWQDSTGRVIFQITFFFFMVGALNLLLTLVSFRWLLKPLVVLLTLTNAMAAWFMQHYHIVFDQGMIRNILETDIREALGILTWGLAGDMLIWGVLPAVILARLPIRWAPMPKQWLLRLGGAATSLALIGGVAAVAYQDYASVFRNHRELRFYILPTSYTYYLARHYQALHKAEKAPFRILDNTPALADNMKHLPAKPVVLFVVGETARAMNFSLNGYERPTNPELAQVPGLINFTQATSCGTDTATSVPCMISYDNRDHYDVNEARNKDNVLDILQRAGYDVVWRDNNSGCKNMCDRVKIELKDVWADTRDCRDDHCFDTALLNRIRPLVASARTGVVIALHMEGSHGPAYFERSPAEFKAFAPECTTAQLQDCTAEQVTNAYDNSIRFTDHVLASAIRVLGSLGEGYAPALVYASDHGESLGEGGIYLHGMPYFIAPDYQTRVPMMMWVSPVLAQETGLDVQCLAGRADQPVSHDNLSHTLTGLLGVRTRLYQPELDLTQGCRRPVPQAVAGESPSVTPVPGS